MLKQQFKTLRYEILCQKRDQKKLQFDVVSMREKMRKNLDASKKTVFDLKQGKGGLVDIEFLTQYFLLNKAYQLQSKNKEMSIPENTIDILMYLDKNELFYHKNISTKKTIDTLISIYIYFREKINTRILNGHSLLLNIDDEPLSIQKKDTIILIWNQCFSEIQS
jgi:glutamate-ammonia-ligase adenylyltransferase